MAVLGKVGDRRKQMLDMLGKQGLLKGDLQRATQGEGASAGNLQPDRFRPAMDTTQRALQTWVQAALNVILGLKLKLDGHFGPITRQALRRFQREEGLQAHGFADEKTLQVLELRVGVRCPRGGQHEPVPNLLIMPMRGVWMPKPKGQKTREKGDGGNKAEATPQAEGSVEHEADDKAATKAKGGEPAATGARHLRRGADDVDSALPQLLVRPDAQSRGDEASVRESVAAARASALTPAFVARAAAELGDNDVATVRAAMDRYFDAQLALPDAQAPAWVRTARADARADNAGVASLLRRVWWAAHVDDEDGL